MESLASLLDYLIYFIQEYLVLFSAIAIFFAGSLATVVFIVADNCSKCANFKEKEND